MIINKHRINNIIAIIPLSLIAVVCLPVSVLSSTTVSAIDNTSVVDKINITVPVSCTLEGTGMNTHNAEITNGTYNSAIGETTLKAFCNDNEGFAIYAIGYTDNLNGKNVLTNSTLGSTHDIPTGTAISGNDSQWAMKLSTITTSQPTYPIIIAGSSDDAEKEQGDPDYSTFQEVPDDYTLVAKRTSGTDIGTVAEGTSLKTTYQSYISKTQPAGTYTGQVKYTLIHPHDNAAPLATMLDTGMVVNAKMKSLAAGTTKAWADQTSDIKAIHMADSLPVDFEPAEANTVSVPDSKYPIYIFFDNTNNAGIMYFYTEGDTVGMNPDSKCLFNRNTSLTDITGLSDWDASQVVDMTILFGFDISLSSLSALANWDTSNVKNMTTVFAGTAVTSLTGLEDWDVSNVTNMYRAFYLAASLSELNALANWDVGNVTDMSGMFAGTSISSLNGLANWNTGNLVSMSGMFGNISSLSDVSAIVNWDTNSVVDMSAVFSRDINLESIDLSNWDTSSVANMHNMFAADRSLQSVNISGWDTSNVTDMGSMFSVGDTNADDSLLTEIIGLGSLDVSNVMDMTAMFYGAGQMTHYDIADWDVHKVESFNHMFCDNIRLESLDLSKWDVSSVKTMMNMFDDNYKLTTIGDVSHWNTISLIDASGWLNWSTSFVGNNGTLDLSGWNTSNLKGANEMFRATKLETIDMSGWTFDSITNNAWSGAGSGIYYEYGTGLNIMFKDTAQLQTVYLSQSGLDSFNAAVNRGVNITDMWSGSAISTFTVK